MPRKVQSLAEAVSVSPEDVALWQQRMDFNDTEARTALGIGSANTWRRYRTEGAPLTVGLAMAAVIRGLGPWPN